MSEAKLRLSDWHEKNLEELPFNQPYRTTHKGCSDKANGTVTRTPAGWVMHCFKCGAKGFQYARVAKLSTTLEPPPSHKKAAPPTDIQWYEDARSPLELAEWDSRLIAFGLSRADFISTPVVGWSPSTERLIFRISGLKYSETTESYCRWTDCGYAGKSLVDKPKWMVYKKDGYEGYCFLSAKKPIKLLVLCEDIISALKIRKAGYGALAMMGLTTSPALISFLLQHSDLSDTKFVVWPDGDAVGISRGRKVYDQLKFLRDSTEFVYVEGKDPKDLMQVELREILDPISEDAHS